MVYVLNIYLNPANAKIKIMGRRISQILPNKFLFYSMKFFFSKALKWFGF